MVYIILDKAQGGLLQIHESFFILVPEWKFEDIFVFQEGDLLFEIRR